MNRVKMQPSDFPGKVEVIFEGWKACKRFVYLVAYFLLTPAYSHAYSAAYLLTTEKTVSRLKSLTRLVAWPGKTAHPGASCELS